MGDGEGTGGGVGTAVRCEGQQQAGMELHGIAYQQHVVDRCSRPHEEFFAFLLYLFLRQAYSFFSFFSFLSSPSFPRAFFLFRSLHPPPSP